MVFKVFCFNWNNFLNDHVDVLSKKVNVRAMISTFLFSHFDRE